MTKNLPEKIYVTFPYGRRDGNGTTECEANVQRSIEIGREIIKRGHLPFLPNLFHYVHTGWLGSPDEDTWLVELLCPWIEVCDSLYYSSQTNSRSRGSKFELDIAKELGKKIYYSLDQIPTIGGR